MCLGVPGRVVRWINRESNFAKAEVQFSGVRREIHMACVTDANLGDYVIVHAGIAICLVDEVEAEQTLAELKSLGENSDETP
ncbi:HypC/HybG/HupF family hydrogenase formation chaperone [Rhodopirellula sp. SWK7]|uniref:HypC/HybG/HupF family hydrogenase formation chaperone n=1 Tax=Rhodopirellula sp. SWK7 TaxID=595460 RepID=UPI0005C6DD8A|nr:HypC/HybG/HupF family hydrogenase formation chaperone [Rhodopirellula sp. SWK7]